MRGFLKTTAVIIILVLAICFIYSLFPLSYADIIVREAEANGIDAHLICALIKAESGFDNSAVSGAGAKGLMQLTDETAAECARELGAAEYDVFNPADNIRFGTYYIKKLLDMYKGDTECALAAYNAGYGNVNKWLSDASYSSDGVKLEKIPFAETSAHTDKVLRYVLFYRYLYPNL
ncbi:MAG: lytic transglycosylase domain-containing protein [Clostridia bacterium]|nr:lytic transglycosylase domain-containing protein [Clostridia bacterium]